MNAGGVCMHGEMHTPEQPKEHPCPLILPLPGLTLHQLLTPAEVSRLESYCLGVLRRGREGALGGKSYVSRPSHWEQSKQGRESVHWGALVKFNKVLSAVVDPLPSELEEVLDRMEEAGLFTREERPDCCGLNSYQEGEWLPPHVDSAHFARPFFTLSLLSVQTVVFGMEIAGKEGSWEAGSGGVELPMPRGSVLKVDGNAADNCMHALNAATSPRISLTFRRLSEKTKRQFEDIRKESLCLREKRRERKISKKLARGRVPKSDHIQSRSDSM